MRKILITTLITLAAATAEAQGLGYAEGGLAGVSAFFGQWSDSFHVGGGGEVVVDDRLGFGAEVGFFNRFLVGSGNVTVHLGGVRDARVSPFVTGGYSWFGIGDGQFNAANVGGGLHFWTAEHVGVRVEFRDHFRPDPRGTAQYWSIRAGIAFR